ncbi:MAG: hypothetical protein ACREJN_21395 [Nitrospiraceae bacterium]
MSKTADDLDALAKQFGGVTPDAAVDTADLDSLAKQFGGIGAPSSDSDVIITPPAASQHGATGTFTTPRPTAAQRIQQLEQNHPYLTAPETFATNVGQGAVEGAKGLLHGPVDVFNAATAIPKTKHEAEVMTLTGPAGLAINRLVIEPSVDNAKKAWDSIKNNPDHVQAAIDVVNAVPVVGPIASKLLEQARKGDIGKAVGEGAVYALAPEMTEAPEAAGHVQPFMDAIAKKAGEVSKDLTTQPATLATRGLQPSDLKFQKHVDAGLKEMKASEAKVGTIKDVPKALKGLESRTTHYNDQIAKLVQPQETVVVPGSATQMIASQINAIPEDIRLHDPDKYSALVNQIHMAHPNDYTIGELNSLRSGLGATQSSFYGKDTSGQLTMDAGVRAMDIARGQASRNLFYHALDNYGLGGGESAAEINSRIGSIIHMKDALEHNLNKSKSERLPLVQREVVRPFRRATGGALKGVDEHVAAAVRKTKELPAPVDMRIGKRVEGITGTPQDLIPMDRNPNNLLQPPRRTSSTIRPETYQTQIDAERLRRSAPPSTTAGEQQPLNVFPSPLGTEQFQNSRSMFEQTTPEEEYLTQIARQKLWSAGGSVPKVGTQYSLERGMAPTVMGVDQSKRPPRPKLSAAEAKTLIDEIKARVAAKSKK